MTLLEVSNSLQDALKNAAAEEAKLEKAKLSLAPLEESAQKARGEVNRLIAEFQKLTGAAVPVKSGRRGVPGKRAAYNQSVESKIAASGKRAYTRAINKGAKPKAAEQAKTEAENAMAAKLGVPVK